MPVPFIDLKRFEPDFLERWAAKTAEISANTMFIAGPEAAKLEEGLAAETGCAGVVACANGTDALQLALRASGVGPGDVVLVPDVTFWASFEAVVNVGARCVTIDIDLDDLQMDYDRYVEAVEKYRPKAAMLVHLYGWGSARLDDFRKHARENDIVLIEDAAQAYGVLHNGESIYKGAQIATVSFYVAKVLGACGDAGAVFCSSPEQTDLVRRLGNHGRSTHYGYSEVGWNSRIGGLDAAYLNLCREYVEARLKTRIKAAAKYREALKAMEIPTVGPPEGYVENGYLNVALIDPLQRTTIEAVLKENGIGFGRTYPSPISEQPGCGDHLVGKVGGNNARQLTETVLNLPLFAYIKDEEIDEALRALGNALLEAGKTTVC